ncbi:LysR substrate-binding domain-containing protein [Kribbella sp. NPDC051770]|uniref:LysR family transcriptional regulator n=1 Tax=Kribbella sp. NPDC051770 TaxID=3155413 RepID=UPI0034161BAA
MDVDLRKVRYFVAVAEELHFGRAAERLHIAQPVLSRQIRALESELKVQLFVRTKRSTELTPAGRQLLEDARPVLASAEAMRRRAVQAARTERTFTIAFMPGITVTPLVRVLSAERPELTVELFRTTWDDQIEVLHDGRADLSIVRLPIDQRSLTVRPLFDEPRVAMLPADHRLAGKPAIHIADLAEDDLLQDPDAVPEWRDLTARKGAARSAAPHYRSVEEKLEHVAAGHGIAIIPLSTATFYTRADVVAVPVEDLGPNQVAIAWSASRRAPVLRSVAEIAQSLSWT